MYFASSISLFFHKLVDGIGNRRDVGSKLLLLDLQRLLLLHFHHFCLFLLGHSCRRWQRHHVHRIVDPKEQCCNKYTYATANESCTNGSAPYIRYMQCIGESLMRALTCSMSWSKGSKHSCRILCGQREELHCGTCYCNLVKRDY